MTPAELAAYIGAAAWLPQIVKWIHDLCVRPVVRIFPDQWATLGFNSAGPIFAVRLVFSAEKAPIIIEQLDVLVRHMDGERRRFRWRQTQEMLHEIREMGKPPSFVGRQQTPIALKVSDVDLVEKQVDFIEPRFNDDNKELSKKLSEHLEYARASGGEEKVSQSLEGKKLYDVLEAIKNWFWWRPGKYEISFELTSSNRFRLKKQRFFFSLAKSDVERLRQNINKIGEEWRTYVRNYLTDERKPFSDGKWEWVRVGIGKV
jgi:hypothetical protein